MSLAGPKTVSAGGEGEDSAPLLHPALGTPLQKGHGPDGAGPEEATCSEEWSTSPSVACQ